jgi:hypothetical protein
MKQSHKDALRASPKIKHLIEASAHYRLDEAALEALIFDACDEHVDILAGEALDGVEVEVSRETVYAIIAASDTGSPHFIPEDDVEEALARDVLSLRRVIAKQQLAMSDASSGIRDIRDKLDD